MRAAALVSVCGLYLFAFLRPQVSVRRGMFAEDRVLNIAHRGGALESPENTLHAFERALQAGSDVLEIDIQRSADGVLFVFHDETLDRTTNGSGAAAEKKWNELQTLDAAFDWNPARLSEPPLRGAGIRIPSLEEVFRKFPGTPMIVEIKPDDPETVAALGLLLDAYDRWDATIVASFHHGVIKQFRKEFPRALTSAGRGEVKRFYLLQKAGLAGLVKTPAHSFQLPERFGPFNLLSRRMLRALRKRGINVHVWTVNEESEMRRIINLGVQGILTDRPSVLADVLRDE